jgi:hypothetical protein
MERKPRGDRVKNVGSTDQVIRLVLALALFALVFILHGAVRWVGLLGIVPLITGLVGKCPLYSLLRVNTCPTGRKR